MLRRLYSALKATADLRLVPQYVRELSKQADMVQCQLTKMNVMLANIEKKHLTDTRGLSDPKRLEKFGFKAYSQNDEDGILSEIFRRIGVNSRQFVEFGTGNGLENNTVFLLCQDWTGVWIDGSRQNHQLQVENFGWAIETGKLKSVQAFLTVENINAVISGAGLIGEIDLLSIDVDGNDYHLWEAIEVVQPRVVVIEYNAYAPPPVRWIMEYDPAYVWDGRSPYFGASLESLERLGKKKGYGLVGCNLTGLNAFFVRADLVEKKFCDDASAKNLFQPRRWWLDDGFSTTMIEYHRPFTKDS